MCVLCASSWRRRRFSTYLVRAAAPLVGCRPIGICEYSLSGGGRGTTPRAPSAGRVWGDRLRSFTTTGGARQPVDAGRHRTRATISRGACASPASSFKIGVSRRRGERPADRRLALEQSASDNQAAYRRLAGPLGVGFGPAWRVPSAPLGERKGGTRHTAVCRQSRPAQCCRWPASS